VQSIEAFEIPAVVGIPGRVFVLTTEIFLELKSDMFPDYGRASAYAIVLMTLAAAGIYYYSRVTRDSKRFTTVTGKGFRPRLLQLGRWRILAAGFVLLLPALIVLPVSMLLWTALQPFASRPSLEGFSTLTLSNFVSVFANSDVQNSVENSAVIGFFAATLSVVLTAVVTWLLVRTRLPGRSVLDYLVSFTLIFPGLVLGVAMLRTYLTLPVPIYGTIWILVVAYLTRSMPFAMRYTYPGLLQIHPELEESAHLSGASWLTTFAKILVPLMMPALFGAWIYVFLVSVREISIAILLVGSTSPVVATAIYGLWENGQTSEMAAFSIIISAFFVIVAVILHRLSQRWGMQVW
jgi:iron(III) transport system permease protein